LSFVKIIAAGLLIWLAPLLALHELNREFDFWMQLALFFTRSAFVTVGGSYTVVPYVALAAVTKYHWLNHSQMLDGFALAETTPGRSSSSWPSSDLWPGFTTSTVHRHGNQNQLCRLPTVVAEPMLSPYFQSFL
jgi:hypothetical protein